MNLSKFDVVNEHRWLELVEKNRASYGAAVMEYAASWAALMEQRMAAGESLETCADPTSDEADVDGITGFMYGCAVQVLAECWRHGEQLRRWHNKRYQPDNAGNLDDEPGAVINPALLHIRFLSSD